MYYNNILYTVYTVNICRGNIYNSLDSTKLLKE